MVHRLFVVKDPSKAWSQSGALETGTFHRRPFALKDPHEAGRKIEVGGDMNLTRPAGCKDPIEGLDARDRRADRQQDRT